MENALIKSTSDTRITYQRKCTVEEKSQLAAEIKPTEIKRLARCLGLDENEIDEVETDCEQNPSDLQETTYQVLVKWEQVKGNQATVEALITALQAIRRKDVAQVLFPNFNTSSKHPLNIVQLQIQELQKRNFEDLQLPRALWLLKKWLPLDDLFVELTMKKKNKTEEDLAIQREEIFDEIHAKKIFRNKERTKLKIPKRILVEGHPGYGKTTLIAKLASDWSNEDNYISDKFDLLFVIPLRNFKDNLESHFLQQCKRVKKSEEEKLQAIEAIEERTLLLLDGLDEASERVKERLLPLLSGEKYPRMTVVVTCRTAFHHLGSSCCDSDFTSMGIKSFENYSIWDKRIQIKGISSERRYEFLRNYLDIEHLQLETNLAEVNFKLTDFYECPLFLILLAVLILEGNTEFIGSKTELYKRIINFLINKTLDRESLLEKEKLVDVFSIKDEQDIYFRNLLIKFSRLCLDKLKIQSLLFEENELLACSGGDRTILNLGILSKQISFFKYEEKEHFEPIHKTFLEFLSAFYLSFLDERELEREILAIFFKFTLSPDDSYHHLQVFAGGFMESNYERVIHIFNKYQGFASLIQEHTQYQYLKDVLLEIPKSDKMCKSMIPVLPMYIKNLPYDASLYDWYTTLFNALQKGNFLEDISVSIPENVELMNCFGNNVKINVIFLNINKFQVKYNLIRDNIRCRKLIIYVETCTIAGTHLLALRGILSKIKADRVYWKIEMKTDTQGFSQLKEGKYVKQAKQYIALFDSIIEGDSELLRIYFMELVDIPPNLFLLIFHRIQELIVNKYIEYGIRIQFSSEEVNDVAINQISSFISIITKSHLQSFDIDWNSNIILPLPGSCFDAEKKWKFLGLNGNFSEIEIVEMDSTSVEHFNCFGFSTEDRSLLLNMLLKCENIRRLSCEDSLIFDLASQENCSTWEGFNTIERLDLRKGWGVTSFKESVTVLFKNVREIHLEYSEYKNYFMKIIDVCPNVKKVCLYNCNGNSENMNLIKCLEMISKHEREIHLDEFQVNGLLKEDDISEHFCECLEMCFAKKTFQKFSIVDITEKAALKFFIYFFHKLGLYKFCSEWKEELSLAINYSSKSNQIPDYVFRFYITCMK